MLDHTQDRLGWMMHPSACILAAIYPLKRSSCPWTYARAHPRCEGGGSPHNLQPYCTDRNIGWLRSGSIPGLNASGSKGGRIGFHCLNVVAADHRSQSTRIHLFSEGQRMSLLIIPSHAMVLFSVTKSIGR